MIWVKEGSVSAGAARYAAEFHGNRRSRLDLTSQNFAPLARGLDCTGSCSAGTCAGITVGTRETGIEEDLGVREERKVDCYDTL